MDAFDIALDFIAREENAPLYEAIKRIKRGEQQFSPSLLLPYQDLSGNPTYAYGIETNRYGKKDTLEEMEMQFSNIIKNDALKPVEKINNTYSLNLNNNQKAALASLIYNYGEDNFKNTNAFKHLTGTGGKEKDMEAFKYEAFDKDQGIVYSKGKKVLVNRRQKELELFETPEQTGDVMIEELTDVPKADENLVGTSYIKR